MSMDNFIFMEKAIDDLLRSYSISVPPSELAQAYIGDTLKTYGVTLEQLAKGIGVTRQALNHIHLGKSKRATMDIIIKIYNFRQITRPKTK